VAPPARLLREWESFSLDALYRCGFDDAGGEVELEFGGASGECWNFYLRPQRACEERKIIAKMRDDSLLLR